MTRTGFIVLVTLLLVGTSAAAVRFMGASRASAAPLQTATVAERELAPRLATKEISSGIYGGRGGASQMTESRVASPITHTTCATEATCWRHGVTK